MNRFTGIVIAIGIVFSVGLSGSGIAAAADTQVWILKSQDIDATKAAVAAAGGRVTHDLSIIGAIAAELTDVQLDAVRGSTDAKVFASPAVKTSGSVADSGYPVVVGADALHDGGVNGAGITVAVLDTGFWRNHEWLRQDLDGQDRVLAEYDAITDTSGKAVDESGHGSHVTSVIASSRLADSGHAMSIAPMARLVEVKAFDA
ncbi:MAG: S8 family serine peptidase, partial [Proteobacteria bacterium]|nr:S8 family serine peptidase [Pseudomonadota bacterium]